jgi:diguanylate cyclase
MSLTNPAIEIANALLSLICEQAKEEAGPDAQEFCKRVRGYQDRLYQPEGFTEKSGHECIDDCTQYFKRLSSNARIRTAEFDELIVVLKEALTQVTSDNQNFHDCIYESSDNFKRLVNLDDIREIKSQLVRLVRELRQAVLEKQQQEELKSADISKRVRELEIKLESARREALTDPVTGVANRASFERTFNSWIQNNKAFVMGMIDIDYFKAINDTHGHQVGDGALVCVARWLGKKLRPRDVLARYGGDEFVVLIEGISLPQAGRRFSDLLIEFADQSYVYTQGQQERNVKFTLSCGLAEFSSGDTLATLIRRADQALYEAKTTRNRACTRARTFLSGVFSARNSK